MKTPQQTIDEAYAMARDQCEICMDEGHLMTTFNDWWKMRLILAHIASPSVIMECDRQQIERERHHCTGIYGVTIHRRPSDGQACEAFLVRAESGTEAMSKTLAAKSLVDSIAYEFLGHEGTSEFYDRQAGWTVRSHKNYKAAGISSGPALLGHYLETETKVSQ